MSKFLIYGATAVLRFINLFFKPFRLKGKVAIISRQSDAPTLDIRLLTDCLRQQNIETVVLTKTLKKICSWSSQLWSGVDETDVSSCII